MKIRLEITTDLYYNPSDTHQYLVFIFEHVPFVGLPLFLTDETPSCIVSFFFKFIICLMNTTYK